MACLIESALLLNVLSQPGNEHPYFRIFRWILSMWLCHPANDLKGLEQKRHELNIFDQRLTIRWWSRTWSRQSARLPPSNWQAGQTKGLKERRIRFEIRVDFSFIHGKFDNPEYELYNKYCSLYEPNQSPTFLFIYFAFYLVHVTSIYFIFNHISATGIFQPLF